MVSVWSREESHTDLAASVSIIDSSVARSVTVPLAKTTGTFRCATSLTVKVTAPTSLARRGGEDGDRVLTVRTREERAEEYQGKTSHLILAFKLTDLVFSFPALLLLKSGITNQIPNLELPTKYPVFIQARICIEK